MDWINTNLYIVDEDGMPAVCTCTHNGVEGYAIVAFTSEAEARRYQYKLAPQIDLRYLRTCTRRTVESRMLQVDLIRAARAFTGTDAAYPVLGMFVNPAAPFPVWVDIQELITHGLRKRAVKSALDELDPD